MTFYISHKNILHTHLASLHGAEQPYPAFLAVACRGQVGTAGATITPAAWAAPAVWLNIVTRALGLWLWHPSLVVKMTFSK